MDIQALWIVVLAIAAPLSGLIGFAIQLRQIKKARLENEKLLLEIELLKENAISSNSRIVKATDAQISKINRASGRLYQGSVLESRAPLPQEPSRNMKIGISIPNNWGVEDPQELIDLAVQADTLGYDSLWVTEHLLNVGYIADRLGDKPYYHSLGMLAYIAARTKSIALGTSVVVLPFRQPADLAKFAATIDQLSGGRVILGIGSGALEAEFDALSIPFKERGAITDETMQVMRALWTQQRASFHGKYWDFDDVIASPKPLQQPHVPMWVAGMGKAAYRRTGQLGDGWHATGIPLEEFVAGRDEIRRFAIDAGRDPQQITMSMRLNVSYGTKFTTETERRSVLEGDDPDSMIAALEEWRATGVDHLVLAPATTDMAQLRSETERIANDVLSRFR